MAVHQALSILLFSFLPMMIGSRSMGSGVSVVSFETSEEADRGKSQDGLFTAPVLTASDEDETEVNNSNNGTVVATTPCALVTMSLLEGRDGKLRAYEEKTLITVSHESFDVSQGIVPTLVYQVALEIPPGHEFSLEFWLNGVAEEKVKQKRRHQRVRRDTLLELYPQTSDSKSPDPPSSSSSSSNSGGGDSSDSASFNSPFVFCSKSSLAGVNRDATAKVLKFHWYINGNNYIPPASVSGVPSNVIFRLRFRSLVEATTSVFEQNLSVIVRPDCYLQLKVEYKTKLTLDSLWNQKTDNAGLNCTIFIVPKKNFGLEISLSSLSVYGMRDICKGRYLQFTKKNLVSASSSAVQQASGLTSGSSTVTTSGSSSSSSANGNSGGGGGGSRTPTSNLKYLTTNNNNHNFLDNFQEFSTSFEFHTNQQKNDNTEDQRQQHQFSPLERKFCGKLEDYRENERILTFPSSESTLLSTTASTSQDQIDNDIPPVLGGGMTLSDSKKSTWGIYLSVRLPDAVKARETFAFEFTALSPCQRVVLNGLDGQLKYSRHYENDQCSVVIHVPYGNTILTQIAVSSSSNSDNNHNRPTLNNLNDSDEPRAVRKSDIITSASNSVNNVLTSANHGNRDVDVDENPENVSSSTYDDDDHTGAGLEAQVEISSASSTGGDNVGNWTQLRSGFTDNVTTYNSNGGVTDNFRDITSDVSSNHHEQQPEDKLYDSVEGEETFDNSIRIASPGLTSSSASSYECPVKRGEEEESNDINSGSSMEKVEGVQGDIVRKLEKEEKHLLIQAVDLVSGSEFNWCFDASKQNSAHKRAWKSSGNRVSINFTLSHFDTFVLTYQSVKIPELAGDCERGWVKVDGACVTLVEKSLRWTDAEESCQLEGGHLVTLKNEQKENKVEKLVTESPLFHPSRAYWIGANDRESEGNFQWTSGLAFQYKNWFPGWTHPGRNDRNDILSAQPNDDGWSRQDCVEIRQIQIPPSAPSSSLSASSSSSSSSNDNKAFAPFQVKSESRSSNSRGMDRGHLSSQFLGQGLYNQDNNKFYWNDRNCEVKNFYLCEKGTHQNVDVSCNRTLKLSPPQVSSVVVTSPAYPSAYPDNIVCVTSIETTPGFKLVLSFDEFILEESPDCQYDSLEIVEVQATDSKAGNLPSKADEKNGVKEQKQEQVKVSRTSTRVNGNNNNGNRGVSGKKICGDWTKKLKLLRYTTASKSTQVILKFESDYSHHFPGYKVKVTAEKDMEEQCTEQQMLRYGNHCYLLVSFPAVTWSTAHQICGTLKGYLASIVSAAEWGFLTRTLLSAPDYDKKSIYWLGGSIDQKNQLGWTDHMPFNFSGFHPADLQTRYDFRCLSIYWHDVSGGGSKGDLAWRLTECSQTAGYVCKKRAQVETRQFMNRTFSGTGGKLASPNYPSNYVNNIDHRSNLIAPRGTKVVIRFSQLDIEPQENCLYDYIEILDRATRNRTRYCGSYQKEDLNRLDYVSSSNELDVIFHTDFSNSFTGYELLWRAVDVTGCMSGKTIMAGFVGSPFPLGDQTIHTPNFPYFNLPHLDCVYNIVAPAGQRIWLNFQVFELGRSLPASSSTMMEENDGLSEESLGESVSWTGINCRQQDHISIDLTGGQFFSSSSSDATAGIHSDGTLLPDLANDNEILICGNLSSVPFRTSFISSTERVVVRVHSPQGHSGRGFLGRFKAIPHFLRESLTVHTEPNSTTSLTSLNFPLKPPSMANLSVSFIAPPQYVIIVKIRGTTKCPQNVKSYLEIRDPYVGKNGVTRIICHLRENAFPSYFVDENGDGGGNKNGNGYGTNVNMGSGSNAASSSNNRLMKNDDMFELVDNNNDMEDGMGASNGISLGTVHFRSRFNRLEVKQVYRQDYHGAKWNAQIITTLDENFRAEVIADGDRLLLLNACSPSPCSNGGTCVTEKGRHICRCPPPFTGPFCALSLCDLNPCLFGECVMEGKSFVCKCQLGYGGERCERRYKPCDDRPCSGHGDCIEVNKTSYKCLCHAWWEGPQCESRMLHIPYKPLSQRMLEEPFWLGLITVFVVMGVIGLIWCLKRHFPEKLEKFLSEDLERNRGISWAPSSVRTGGVVGPGSLGVRDAIAGTSQQAASPPTTRSFLGRLGIRKPSLLSLSSATSNVSATVASPHTYENRTFSLDDLLRPSRGMLRTPSPHRRRNYSVQVRRDPAEKQQILQQLVSPGPSVSFDGESKPATPKPTLAEIIQMSEKRLRLASQSSMQEPQPSTSAAAAASASGMCSVNTSIDSVTSTKIHGQDSAETSFTTIVPHSSMSTIHNSAAAEAQRKAEKKVTFAHMLDKLAAGEMTSSSSCSDISCGEESKMIVTVPLKPVGKKDRKGRFRRSKSYRSRTSEEDGAEISSSDTTPDPIFPPRFPLRICISPTSASVPSISTASSSATNTLSSSAPHPAVPTTLIPKPPSSSGKLTKIASADSLLSLFRRFSGSSSAPPSPQYSENEESSAGATPLSTPSSPRNSALSLRPPAFLITTPEPTSSSNSSGNATNNNNNNTIELPVIDPFSNLSLGPGPGQSWNRSSGSPGITLEVPMRDYCLSPIHEVPTPLPTPSHSPAHTPMMRRSPQDGIPMIKVQSSEEEEPNGMRREPTLTLENINPLPPPPPPPPRKLAIPLISISMDGDSDNNDNINNNDDDEDDGVDVGNDDDNFTVDDEEVPECVTSAIANRKRKNSPFPGEPEIIPDVLINVPPDASVEGKPEQCNNSSDLSSVGASPTSSAGVESSGPGPPGSQTSSSREGSPKPRPPPLIFANEMLSSCSSKVSKEDSAGSGSGNGSTSSSTGSTGSFCSSSCTSITSTSSSGSSSSGSSSSCGGADGGGGSGCGEGGSGGGASSSNIGGNNNIIKGPTLTPLTPSIPLLNVEFATPVTEALPKFVTTSPPEEAASFPLSEKNPTVEVVSCLAVPVHIWDCPLMPPMITINQSSEAESDSDTTLAKSIRRPNLNFLSPFACDTIRVPSESNLSTSGYSSMASPCASRCPSVSPLCPSEMDDYHNCHHSHSPGSSSQFMVRRASLTPGTPKKPSPSPRRSSLNSGTPLMSFTSGSPFLEKRSLSEERYEEDKKKLAEVEIETDSAVEIETDLECQANITLDMTASTNTLLEEADVEDERSSSTNGNANGSGANAAPSNQTQLLLPVPVPEPTSASSPSLLQPSIPIFAEELKCINNLLQVPKKGFPKSRSLDINSSTINDLPSNSNNSTSGRNQQLKVLGPSLDSKLNSIGPFWNKGGNGGNAEITISLPMTTAVSNKTLVAVHHSAGNLMEVPDDGKDQRRLSPVSSRSESPLSELSTAGGGGISNRFTGSPGSDSDGMYDCPSSEVPSSNHNDRSLNIPRLTSLNKLSPQQQLRRSGRRKDRRMARNRVSATTTCNNNNNASNNNIVGGPGTSGTTSTTNELLQQMPLPPPLIPSPVVYHSVASTSTPSPVDMTGKLPPRIVGPPGVSTSVTSPNSVFIEGQGNSGQFVFPHIDLPPSLARESLLPASAISKRASPKRRVRAQPALDASSSSSESLSSRSRSRTSVSSFQQSSGSPKRSLEEADTAYAMSDSAIGKRNSFSDVVTTTSGKEKDATKAAIASSQSALLQREDCAPSTSRKCREISPPKPDVIQQQPTTSGIISPRVQEPTGSGSPARRKISRLRTISHQIRFLRRLELSLIRKKECLTSVSRPQEVLLASNSRRDSFLARSDSWDTSREEDLSDSTESTSDEQSGKEMETGDLHEATDKPLLPRSSSSPGTLCFKGPSSKKLKSSSSSGSSRMMHMDLLDNCSAAELLSSHKRRNRRFK